MIEGPATEIVCVECGGTAHLISVPPPDEPFVPGDVVAYRCSDCMERLDLVYEVEETEDPEGWTR